MTFVERKNPFDIGMMDEIPRRYDPRTGKLEPINPPETPWTTGGANTMEWNYERDGQNPLAGFGPIGAYNPDTDESKVVPLDFLGGFMKDRNLADLSDYRRKWIRHTSGKDVITDPVYRKNLQDIILYPDRFGFNTRV